MEKFYFDIIIALLIAAAFLIIGIVFIYGLRPTI